MSKKIKQQCCYMVKRAPGVHTQCRMTTANVGGICHTHMKMIRDSKATSWWGETEARYHNSDAYKAKMAREAEAKVAARRAEDRKRGIYRCPDCGTEIYQRPMIHGLITNPQKKYIDDLIKVRQLTDEQLANIQDGLKNKDKAWASRSIHKLLMHVEVKVDWYSTF